MARVYLGQRNLQNRYLHTTSRSAGNTRNGTGTLGLLKWRLIGKRSSPEEEAAMAMSSANRQEWVLHTFMHPLYAISVIKESQPQIWALLRLHMQCFWTGCCRCRAWYAVLLLLMWMSPTWARVSCLTMNLIVGVLLALHKIQGYMFSQWTTTMCKFPMKLLFGSSLPLLQK